jgi:uncharacterized protein (TIGR02001 family)
MTFKRSVVSAAVLGASVFSGSALAELSGNIGVVSEYLFRGLEQSGGAAVQGGLDYSSESGFYVGTWASTIGFAGGALGGSGAEVDFYAGFSGEAGGIGYDVGAIYYWYSEEDEVDNPDPSYNTIELYGSLSFGMLTVGGYYAPDKYFGVDEDAYGVNLAFSAPVSDKLSFDAFIGHNGGNGNKAFTPDGDTYLDYSIGLSTETEIGISMSIAFVGTDIKDDDPKLVLSGGYSFGL